LVPVCNRTFADPAATAVERERVRTYYAGALAVVSRAFGDLHGERPAVIFCKTDSCRKYFAGSFERSVDLGTRNRASGAAYFAEEETLVITKIDASAQVHLAHELVHVELRTRIGSEFLDELPSWFNEGVATSIADPGDCDGEPKGLLDLRTLDANRAWRNYTNLPGRGHPTYCQARAEVTTWLARNGRQRFFWLLDWVRAGRPFYEAYGPMLTQ
jgi:hypothetical protein